jgi:hypothetical protein
MWRNKKFIIIAVLTVLVLGATLGGVAIAQADDEDINVSQTANASSFLDKVAEIYQQNTGVAIDADELQKAMTEAGQALKDDAQHNFLQKLVEDGRITQEQADEFETWLEARPTLPTEEFKGWWDSRPDMPGLFGEGDGLRIGPFGGMHRGAGKFGMGFRMGRWCAPDAEIE